jgi:UDP-N-acetylglucosamine 2-epimerase (non-hydrolysing)
VAQYNFAPTENARGNLLREGISDGTIHVTGNTVIDALFMVLERIGEAGEPAFAGAGRGGSDAIEPGTVGQRMILVTGHRRESFGEGLRQICRALKKLADHNPHIRIIYPVHLNPHVLLPVRRALGDQPNVQLISPVDYLRFVHLLNQCYFVLTDSGGIQEEAPSLGKPVLVMRNTTERPEGIEAGTAKLVGTNSERILAEAQKLLDDKDAYEKMSRAANPYGDGKASERIVRVLLQKT